MRTRRIFGFGRFSQRKMVMYLIALSVITLLSLLILWFVAYLYQYEIEYYEPRDQDREQMCSVQVIFLKSSTYFSAIFSQSNSPAIR